MCVSVVLHQHFHPDHLIVHAVYTCVCVCVKCVLSNIEEQDIYYLFLEEHAFLQ